MKLHVISAAWMALVLAGCSSTGQQSNSSTAPDAKQAMTDPAIHADYANYEAQQGRIKALNDTGKQPVGSYALSKAQCWLDVSLHEYSRNDRSQFPRLALQESSKITQELQTSGSSASAQQTPLLNDASKLRPDLWDAASKLKGHPGWRCAEQKTACAEVELVHAGNEFNQQQWRHAKPYVQIAEDLMGDAQKAAEACIPAPVVKAPPPPPAVVTTPPPPPPEAKPFNASANVLFNFDKRDMANVRSYTKDQLDALIGQIKSGGITVSSIKLVGHADRLNSTGDNSYNVKLSQDRATNIKNYMVSQGIAANLMTTGYEADNQQLDACTKNKFRNTAELQECLLPNRRVEVIVNGMRN
jgi:OmpA-OmpF porin, OOP family